MQLIVLRCRSGAELLAQLQGLFSAPDHAGVVWEASCFACVSPVRTLRLPR